MADRASPLRNASHLARRFFGSLSRRPPDAGDQAWVDEHLDAAQLALWARLGGADQRHSILVARRFVAIRPGATTPEIAGALLHDIGKLESSLGVAGRIVATVVGPRGRRLRTYHDHEEVGAAMLRDAGSDEVTVELVAGRGDAAPALATADEV
ncbi:MAG: HDIG domain-containing protein [Actinomycetota bacterium]|nr:HDIG domain-containing protein [Actinomycetota bacterium]